jgi:RNA polymerase sigma-70 factor, ECF subfamily
MRHSKAGSPAHPPSPAAPPPTADEIAADRSYHALIRRILLRKGVDGQDVADVHQEVIMAVIAYVPSLGQVRSMEALIARISLRHADDYLKARNRHGWPEAYDEETAAPPPSSQQSIPAPEKASLLKERARALDVLLGRMEPEIRDAFILVELEEMTLRETAEALDLPDTTVKSRLDRARERFEELLGPVRADLKRGGYL